jgi:transcriptional regulator with XRE-family HTH domain
MTDEQRRPEPTRITAALNLRELYGPEVDRACGVAEPAVDMWESGELVPTDEQVAALAELTRMPVDYFYGPPLPELTGWICYRTRPGKGEPRCQPFDTAADRAAAAQRPVQGLLFG